jgi:chemotaxis methyl-accepting protein methylase
MTIASGLSNRSDVTPAEDFQRYVDTLGQAIASRPADASPPYRRIAVSPQAAATVSARFSDVVVDRFQHDADLVIVTNVLPYFDDRELALALTNIHAMLAPGGVLLHNEARPEVGEISSAIGLPLLQARTAMIATVRGASPLYDSVFIHTRR